MYHSVNVAVYVYVESSFFQGRSGYFIQSKCQKLQRYVRFWVGTDLVGQPLPISHNVADVNRSVDILAVSFLQKG